METLYSPQVREYVHSRPWPKGLKFEVREEYMDVEGIKIPQLTFLFFRDNWVTLEPADQLKVALLVKEVIEKLRADKIPAYMGAMQSATGH